MVTGIVHTIGDEQSGAPQLRMFHSLVAPCRRPFEEHRHTAYELSLICGGSGLYRAGGRDYPFQEGDIFLFSSNETHCIVEVTGEEPLNIMNLQFEPRFLWSPENLLFQVQYPDIFSRRNDRYVHRLSVKEAPAKEIARRLRAVESEFRMEKTDFRLMVKLQILELLVLIRLEYADFFREPAERINVQYLAQMEQALDYIHKNLTRELQLEQVAREAAMSPAYFSSLFKKLNGLSLWEYVQTRRIELASEMLVNTRKNVSEIALECGYNSLSNFNRSFKALTGQTPVAYRKMNTANR